jgi:hypothetical protein
LAEDADAGEGARFGGVIMVGIGRRVTILVLDMEEVAVFHYTG